MEKVKHIVKQSIKGKQRSLNESIELRPKYGSPGRTRTYNLAVNSHCKKVRTFLRLKARHESVK